MKKVCDRYGALVIFDEVMCGLGRTGTYHAWEQEGVVPDIQAVGKGLGAGFSTISAILFNERIVSGLKQGSGNFEHGQTYQCHPVSCAAALEVQRIIQEKNLVENAREMGVYLGQLLKERFEGNVNIGDVRGRGMFWCVEIVTAKVSKLPFDPALNVAKRMRMRGLEPGFDVCLFSAQGSVDGWSGDHFLLAPPFIAQPSDIEEIVSRTARAVESVLAELKQPNGYFNGVN